jgi:hypothetical protein
VSNGPTENLNLEIKNTNRKARRTPVGCAKRPAFAVLARAGRR